MSDPEQAEQIPASPADPMNVDRQSIEGIFVEALGKASPDERRAFLDAACEGDRDRRLRVEALLKAYDDAGSFLQQAAGDWRNPPGVSAGEAATAAVDSHGIPVGLLRPSDKPGCLGLVGSYEVQELIGRGGMGIVLRAIDPKLNRVVAIKLLAPELAAHVTSRRRFLREAQAAAAVSHPHIVTIHAVDEDQLPYLVMECVVGRSLQQKIDQTGSLALKEILRIGTQIAEGLAAAHKRGLMHRDIKPANILLENGVERAKITDFGLARSVDEVALTRTGEVAGTPQYMSPEQALGHRVDHRSDLFSLGCVLYAMCTGRPPFRGDNVAVVAKRICDESPRPIEEINAEIPGWLIGTINRLLAKDPAQRFQTAAEVADVLSGHLACAQQPQGGRLPPPSVAPAPPPVAPRSLPNWLLYPLPTWLLYVAFGVAGYFAGRMIPFTGRYASVAVLLTGALAAGAIVMRRGHSLKLASSMIAALVFGGVGVYWVGMVVESELHVRGDSGAGDAVMFGLAGLLLAHALFYGRRRAVGASPGVASAPAERDGSRQQLKETLGKPWHVAGWLVVALLTLLVFIPCLIVIPLALWIPAYQARQATSEMGSLTIDFDPLTPITQIKVVSGPSNVHNVFPVASRPFFMRFPTGEYTLELTYVHDGERFTLAEPFVIARGGDHHMNLALAIDDDLSERLRNKAKVQLQNNGAPPLVREEPDDPGEPQ
jgi:serine/threonine protein kinase